MQSVGWWLPVTASGLGTVPWAPLAWLRGRGEARARPTSGMRLHDCLSVPLPLPSAEGKKSPRDYPWGTEGSWGPPGFVIPDKGTVAQPQS